MVMIQVSEEGKVVIGFIILYWSVILTFARRSFRRMDQFIKENKIKHDSEE